MIGDIFENTGHGQLTSIINRQCFSDGVLAAEEFRRSPFRQNDGFLSGEDSIRVAFQKRKGEDLQKIEQGNEEKLNTEGATSLELP